MSRHYERKPQQKTYLEVIQEKKQRLKKAKQFKAATEQASRLEREALNKLTERYLQKENSQLTTATTRHLDILTIYDQAMNKWLEALKMAKSYTNEYWCLMRFAYCAGRIGLTLAEMKKMLETNYETQKYIKDLNYFKATWGA
ncbi:hypothetical protein ACFQ02_03790 [Seminibacterium arietis]|uniref:Uncharacterized protein n=1 Tax=Seminibacterium arietis TaxID=1173502 RepID=A0ABW3I960_9PAST